MRLIDNWKDTLIQSWSARIAVVGISLGLLEQLVPMLQDILPRWAFVLLMLCILGARLVYQESMHGTKPKE